MADLSVEFAGMKLKNPLIVGAGPSTKNLPSVVKCIKAGFGGVVVRSLHLQHLGETKPPLRGFWYVYSSDKNYRKTYYSFQSTSAPAQRPRPKIATGFGGAARFPSLEEWTEEVRKMKQVAKEYDCAIIASLGWCGSNLADKERWQAEAKAMTDAGADALQLHTGPSPATEPGRYMTIDAKKHLEEPIQFTREASKLPVFAKLPVDCCDIIAMAGIAQKAGAAGVVPSTRWVSLSIDIEHEKDFVDRGPGLGGPWSAPIMNGLIYRMRNAMHPVGYPYGGAIQEFPDATTVTVPIVASGGVRSGADVIGYMISGANAAEACSQVIVEGTQVAGRITREMLDWMQRKGYRKISDFQGTLRLLPPSESKKITQWSPVVDKAACNACRKCVETCPNEAITIVKGTATINDDYCEGCTTCYYVCPTNAISLKP